MFFFVQVACEADARSFETIRKLVARVGRVRDKGRGTSEDPQAGWFEVSSTTCGSIAEVRAVLQPLGVQVQKVLEIDRGEGKLQARQLSLFGGV